MLLGTLAEGMLGNMLTGKLKIFGRGVIRDGKGTIPAGEETARAGQDF